MLGTEPGTWPLTLGRAAEKADDADAVRLAGTWAMTQPVLPPDKTFRMRVKLVNEDGDHVPFKGGFVLVPEDRLVLLEKLATAARDVVARNRDAMQDVNQIGKVTTAVKALDDRVGELEKVWDIP